MTEAIQYYKTGEEVPPIRTMAQRPIAIALAKVQAEIVNPHKDQSATVVSKRTGKTFTYEYVGLATVLDAVRPILTKHGIALLQMPEYDPTTSVLSVATYLMHGESGDEVACSLATKCDGEPQVVGSAITYLRRYSLVSMLGIAPDEDDDANAAQGNKVERAEPAARAGRPPGRPLVAASSANLTADRILDAKKGFYVALNAAFNAHKLDANDFMKDKTRVLHLLEELLAFPVLDADALDAGEWATAERLLRENYRIPRAKPETMEQPA